MYFLPHDYIQSASWKYLTCKNEKLYFDSLDSVRSFSKILYKLDLAGMGCFLLPQTCMLICIAWEKVHLQNLVQNLI